MDHSEFVAEGALEIGPSANYFVFLDEDFLGQQIMEHFQLPEERGYTRLGRVRATIDRLEE